MHYERSVALDPKNINALKNLADFYYVEMSHIENSQRMYSRIISIQPTDIETLQIMGNILYIVKAAKCRERSLCKDIVPCSGKFDRQKCNRINQQVSSRRNRARIT